MAIQLRRGNETDLDISRLQPGETAVCLDTGKIIVKLTGGNYLTLTDMPALRAIVDGKAPASHTHAQSDVTGLADALSGKAASNHNHSGVYAPKSHTHTKSQITDLSSLSAASGGTDTSLCTTGEKHTWNSKMSYKVLRNTRASMGSSGYFALDEMSSDESLIDYLYVDLIVLISNDGYQTVRMYKNAAGNGFYKTRCIMLGGVSSGATSVNVATGAFTWNSENPRQLYYTLTREQSAYGIMVDRVIGYK